MYLCDFVAFVEVKAALHADDGRTVQPSKDETPYMADHCNAKVLI